MQSRHLVHGPIHAVIYPKRRTGVMLVPDEFLSDKDHSHHWERMRVDLAELGLQPELDLDVLPAIVRNVECVAISPILESLE